MSLFRRVAFVGLVIAAAGDGVAFASDWSMFRGPGGNASSNDSDLPTTWSDSENIVWKTPIPGHGSSSPVTWGDRIFLTTYSGYGMDVDEPGEKSALQLHVLCFDRASGRLLWNKSRPASENEQDLSRRIADHGYATSTPVCDETGVYAYFGVSGIAAYTLEGHPKWQAPTGEKTAGFGSAASPVLFENLVIVNASIECGSLFAFDKQTGKLVWRVDEIKRSWTTPTIAAVSGGEPELVISKHETVLGLDPRTGEQLWSCVGIQDYVVPCAVFHQGVVYCLGGRKNQAMAIKLGGRGDVTDTHKLWEESVGANVTSPVYSDGHLYWASDKAIAYCLDAKTGELVYRERLPTRARIYASAILAADKLYCTTRDAGVVVLKAAPKFEQLAVNVLKEDESMFNATPAVSKGQLLIRTNQFLYCIGK